MSAFEFVIELIGQVESANAKSQIIVFMLPRLKNALAGKRILVTGGTGFIGGRLIEKLMGEYQVEVRALVRDLSRACRVARFPVELVCGDLMEFDAVDRAARGCDIIFHCAYGNSGSPQRQRAVNVEGTRHVLDAAVKHKVQRLIHLSTMLVYGVVPDGDLDETTAKNYLGHVYADSKLDTEKLIAHYAQGRRLQISVLQPGVVFGPYGLIWTEYVLKQLRAGRQILIDGGDGFCNAVFVDDVVNAMLLAAVSPHAAGESFLIAGSRPVTWKDFYSRHEEMLGISATVSMSAEEAYALYETGLWHKRPASIVTEAWRLFQSEPRVKETILRSREAALLLGAAQRIIPTRIRQSLKRAVSPKADRPQEKAGETKPVIPLEPLTIRLFQSKARIRIDKARKLLGYEPVFSFEAGMRLTKRWARWSNLLGPAPVTKFSQ